MAGLFGALAQGIERKSAQVLDMLPGFMMGSESKSGVAVTWSTALQVMAMFACCRVVGEDIAQLRCRLMRPRKTGGGADQAHDHALFDLLYLEPTKGLSAFNFWEMIVFHLLLVGNAFIFINRVNGRIFELIPIEPSKVVVTRHRDLSLTYEIDSDGHRRSVPADWIWHVRGPSWNGWMGLDVVRLAREALGLALALEQSHAAMHKNDLKTPGIYSIDGKLDADDHEKLKHWIKQVAATGDPMILDRAAKWTAQVMSGVDSEHLATRKFQIEEICRAARVMPIMVGVPGAAGAYDNGEQMFLAHFMNTLAPMATRLEMSGAVALLTEQDRRDRLYLKFNLSAKMRGDFKSRQEGLQIMRRNGIVNADEWRDLEDMNPREGDGGGQYIVEGNMAVQDGRDLVPIKNVVV